MCDMTHSYVWHGSFVGAPEPYPRHVTCHTYLLYPMSWLHIHRWWLQHTATHCNTLQHTATNCNTLQHAATHSNTWQHTTPHCNTLHAHNTTRYNTLQNTAKLCTTRYNTLKHTEPVGPVAVPLHITTHCNTLQHTATHCNTLQHTATHYNALPHTLQHTAITPWRRCACSSVFSCSIYVSIRRECNTLQQPATTPFSTSAAWYSAAL